MNSEEFAKHYEPTNGFLLLEKSLIPEKTAGGIVIAQTTKDQSAKWRGAAKVLKKPRVRCEDDWEQYCVDLVRIGDIVLFGATSPIMAPAPANIQFDNVNRQADSTATIHATDIVGFFFENEKDHQSWAEHVEKVNARCGPKYGV